MTRPVKNAERDAKIVADYLAGSSLRELSAVHHLSFQRLYQIVELAGATRPSGTFHRIVWTADMDAMLRRLRNNGVGCEAAADRIGVSRSVVEVRLRRLDLPTGHPRSPGAEA